MSVNNNIILFGGHRRVNKVARLNDFRRAIAHLQKAIKQLQVDMKATFQYIRKLTRERKVLISKPRISQDEQLKINQIDEDLRYLNRVMLETKSQEVLRAHIQKLKDYYQEYNRRSS